MTAFLLHGMDCAVESAHLHRIPAISSDFPPLPFDRLRVGECTVDVALREVHAPGAKRARRITPKSMAVLLVLVENADRVVARDTLLARVWPDTLPTNDVVTQAITQLRKALGEAQGSAPYIETIAKGGYRLLAAVEHIAPAAVIGDSPLRSEDAMGEHGALPPTAGQLPGRGIYPFRHAMISGISTIALLLAVAVLWTHSIGSGSGRAAVPTDEVARLQTRMITSAPGFELAPALSPDAAMVAYMAVPPGQRSIAIMVQTTAPTAPRQLTHPGDVAHDGNPQWSPDGREIAFLRVRAGRDCRIMITPANGGAERSVGACDLRNLPSYDWTPDGNGLIFGSHGLHGGAGLHLLDLHRGEWTALPYGAGQDDVDLAPRFSPDGRWIVFVRNAPLGDFWRVPAAGGTAERLTHMTAEIRGWDWAHDGASLIYGRRHDSESRLYRLDLRDGESTDMGIVDGEYPVVAARVPALAYVDRRSYFGIHRVDLDAAEGAEEPERLFASSGRDRLPSVAPDGRQLVFTSDRAGEFGLWWADLEQRSPRLIPGVRPESRYLASWSPDSRRVLLEGTSPAGLTGIFEVIPGSGRTAMLPIPLKGPVQAMYLPDAADASRLLVIAGGAGGRLALSLLDRSVSPWRELARIQQVSLAQVDPVGQRVVFTRPGEAGLWQADLQLSAQSVRRLNGVLPATSRYQAWTVAADGSIFTTNWRADCAALLSPSEASPTLGLARCLHPDRRAARTGFSVSVRTGEVFVSLIESEGGDIGFVMLGNVPDGGERRPATD